MAETKNVRAVGWGRWVVSRWFCFGWRARQWRQAGQREDWRRRRGASGAWVRQRTRAKRGAGRWPWADQSNDTNQPTNPTLETFHRRVAAPCVMLAAMLCCTTVRTPHWVGVVDCVIKCPTIPRIPPSSGLIFIRGFIRLVSSVILNVSCRCVVEEVGLVVPLAYFWLPGDCRLLMHHRLFGFDWSSTDEIEQKSRWTGLEI